MAQRVGYWEDGVVYAEGPFVMVNANGWRIEVECKRARHSALPNSEIYDLMRGQGMSVNKTIDPEPIAKAVDWLNSQVRIGRIVEGKYGWTLKPVGVGELRLHSRGVEIIVATAKTALGSSTLSHLCLALNASIQGFRVAMSGASIEWEGVSFSYCSESEVDCDCRGCPSLTATGCSADNCHRE